MEPDEQRRTDRPDDPGAVGVLREVAHQSLRDDIIGMSAELAFRFFLALFPFFIFLSALGGLIASELRIENPAEQAVELIGDALPAEGTQFVEDQLRAILDDQGSRELLGGALLAILVATGGTNAVIKALNRAYGVREHRPFWRRYLLALVITVTAGAGVVTAFALFIPVRAIVPRLTEMLEIDGIAPALLNALAIVASMVLVFVAVALLFRIGPSIRVPARSVLPGAALFGVGWLVATYLFGTWVSDFADYASSYGMLANVAVVMVWFYVLGFVLILCAELNVGLMRASEPQVLEQRRRESAEHRERILERAHDTAARAVNPRGKERESGAATG